jgi:hypothetical protein
MTHKGYEAVAEFDEAASIFSGEAINTWESHSLARRTSSAPDTPVTRGIMAVLIIRRRYGVATPSSYPSTPYFTDVGLNHAYFPWIQR